MVRNKEVRRRGGVSLQALSPKGKRAWYHRGGISHRLTARHHSYDEQSKFVVNVA